MPKIIGASDDARPVSFIASPRMLDVLDEIIEAGDFGARKRSDAVRGLLCEAIAARRKAAAALQPVAPEHFR